MSALDLLPPNATPLERALAAVGPRLDALPVPLRELWDPWRCPSSALPYLAWSMSVEEEWDLCQTEGEQRALIAASYELHAHKGTPWAVERGLEVAGFAGATVLEGGVPRRRDGTWLRDGSITGASNNAWALFSVLIDLGTDKGWDTAMRARALRAIRSWQRASCHLEALRLRANLWVPPVITGPALGLHLGLGLTYSTGPRDGRYRRGGTRPLLRDGTVRGDGRHKRGDVLVVGGDVVAGPGRSGCGLHVGLALDVPRAAPLVRDGTVKGDGRFRRGAQAAIQVTRSELFAS